MPFNEACARRNRGERLGNAALSGLRHFATDYGVMKRQKVDRQWRFDGALYSLW